MSALNLQFILTKFFPNYFRWLEKIITQAMNSFSNNTRNGKDDSGNSWSHVNMLCDTMFSFRTIMTAKHSLIVCIKRLNIRLSIQFLLTNSFPQSKNWIRLLTKHCGIQSWLFVWSQKSTLGPNRVVRKFLSRTIWGFRWSLWWLKICRFTNRTPKMFVCYLFSMYQVRLNIFSRNSALH